MKLPLLILIVSASVFLTACKKETTHAFYVNATFETETIVSVKPVRVFTINGEITDTSFIRNFITRNTTGYGFVNPFLFNTQAQALDPSLSLKINFRENNTARLERYSLYFPNPSLEIHEADFYSTSPSELLVTESDSLGMGLFLNSYCFDLSSFDMLQNKPVKDCVPTSSNTQYCKWRNVFPIKIIGMQLELPMITTIVVRGFTGSSGYTCVALRTKDLWGIFDSNVINILQPTDTIAFQAKDVLLKKL